MASIPGRVGTRAVSNFPFDNDTEPAGRRPPRAPIQTRGDLSIDGGGTTTFRITGGATMFDVGYQQNISVNRLTVSGAGTVINAQDFCRI